MSYRYQYDSAGRLTAVIGTDGKLLETVAYGRAGRRSKVETAGGSGASYAYTAAGWQTHIETKGGAANPIATMPSAISRASTTAMAINASMHTMTTTS